MKQWYLFASVLMAFAVVTNSGSADTSWNVSSGTWSNSANWSDGIPDAADAYINILYSSSSVCTLNTNEGLFPARLVVQNGQTLNIENGGYVGTAWARVGRTTAAYVNMSGNGTFVMNDDDLYIGLEGGSCVWSMSDTSTLMVAPATAGSDELYIGEDGGSGTLKLIGSGVTVQVDVIYFTANSAGGTATLEFVMDAGGASPVIAGSTNIAAAGSAHLVLSSTADLAAEDIVLIETTGTGAIGGSGFFNTMNGGSAAEGAWADVGGNTYLLTYQYDANGDSANNDIALIYLMPTPYATDPSPSIGQKVDPDKTVLSWQPGPGAIRSEVYLGTSSSAIAVAAKPVGDVDGDGWADIIDLAEIAAQWLGFPADPCPDLDYSGLVDLSDVADLARDWGQSADSLYLGATGGSTFDPGSLDGSKTYYWRVDTVHCGGIIKGPVWSFQTKLPAFPGAEGFGKWASGGRGGSVYHVTNLNDSGPGSFRDAVSATNRTVVFDVGGVIHIGERIVASKDITIAGQTAPGEGIMIYGNGLSYTDANRSITRYMRYRMGIGGTSEKDTITIADGTDMIFDHCSVSWGRDETFSISGGTGEDPGFITIQDCIIAQGLETHSCGGLIQDFNGVSLLRNLYIDNDTRNPKVKGINEFINNVVYNWDDAGYILGDSEADSYANVIRNYFISGPNTGAAAFTRGNLNFHIYALNNWHDSDKDGVLDGAILSQAAYGTVDWQTAAYDYPGVKTMLYIPVVYKFVASRAGAAFPVQDRTDARLIKELLSCGTSGQLISNENNSPMYGIGNLEGGIHPTDTDQDGMPDYWEQCITGLNPAAADNNGDLDGNGYTNLEEYLNWLAGPHADVQKNTPLDLDLRKWNARFSSGTVYSVFDAEGGTVTLLADGHTARFTPETDYTGPAGFKYTLTDGSGFTETVGLLVSEYGGYPLEPVYPSNLTGGLTYKYYTGTWEYMPDFNTLTPAQQGTIANFNITGAPAADYFAYDFEGFLDVPADGQYTFYVNSDDGSRLYIDGGIVVSNDGVHGSQEAEGKAALLAGKHSIRVKYFENSGGQTLEVQWAGPGFSKQPIADAALYSGSLDTIPPAAPTGLWAVASSGTVSLDWNDNSESDLAGYNVYRTTVSGNGHVQVNGALLTQSDYIDNTAVNGTLYHYIVKAVDTSMNESDPQLAPDGRTAEVSAEPTASGTSTVIQEYTIGYCSVDGTSDYNNAGFTGYGFANGTNGIGYGVNWKINIASAGTYTLTWRYANGTTTDRPGSFLVGGSPVVSGISFPGTGAWTTWGQVSRTAALPAGSLNIRLEATTSNGLANIDYILISGADVQPADCP